MTDLYIPPPHRGDPPTGAHRVQRDPLWAACETLGGWIEHTAQRSGAALGELRREQPTLRRIDAFYIAIASGVVSMAVLLMVIAFVG